MFKARQIRELVVEIRNDIGVLHELSRIMAEKGVNIMALQGGIQDGRAVIRMVTDDNLRASDALRARKYDPREAGAVMVMVPHQVGMLRVMTEKLGKAGIDIDLIYATARIEDSVCMMVLATSDNERAIVELNR